MLASGRPALDHLFSVTYEELRRLAARVRQGDPSATLTPTALVNEAWIKLADTPGLGTVTRLHFKRIAARERDGRSLVRGDLLLGRQEVFGGNHLEAGFFQFSQGCLVSRV